MIYFRQVYKKFTQPILEDISFSLPSSGVVAVIGPNGHGKTTSLKMMLELLPPDQGEILFDSSLGKNQKERKYRRGFMPERPIIFPFLSGREYLRHFCSFYFPKKSKEDVEEKIENLANYLELGKFLEQKIEGYSKGMCQKLCFIASALHLPQCLILDEPFSGLDPRGRDLLKSYLKEHYSPSSQKLLIMTGHVLAEIEEMAQYILVLQNKKLHFAGENKHFFSTIDTQKIFEHQFESEVNIDR